MLPPTLASAMRSQALPLLGSLLTTSAFARLVDASGIWSSDDRRLGELIEGCHDHARGVWHLEELLAGLDEMTRAQRMGVAADIGPKLLVRLLDALRQPFDRLLEIEQVTGGRGGRPSNWKRDFVVPALIPAFEKETGRRATATKGGPFVEYCANALRALGLDETGIEDAVAAVLQRRRERSAPARCRGRPSTK